MTYCTMSGLHLMSTRIFLLMFNVSNDLTLIIGQWQPMFPAIVMFATAVTIGTTILTVQMCSFILCLLPYRTVCYFPWFLCLYLTPPLFSWLLVSSQKEHIFTNTFSSLLLPLLFFLLLLSSSLFLFSLLLLLVLLLVLLLPSSL